MFHVFVYFQEKLKIGQEYIRNYKNLNLWLHGHPCIGDLHMWTHHRDVYWNFWDLYAAQSSVVELRICIDESQGSNLNTRKPGFESDTRQVVSGSALSIKNTCQINMWNFSHLWWSSKHRDKVYMCRKCRSWIIHKMGFQDHTTWDF